MSKIVLGFSGGVDSTVSTMLLKKAGHEVYGLYMDNADEAARQYAIDTAEFIGVPLTVLDVSRLRELTFCLIYRQSTQREVIDPLFDAAGCKANLFLETGSNRANISMVRRGLSCSILPAHYVRGVEDVARFRLSTCPTWTVSACCRRGHYLSQAARHFIQLAGEYFQSAGTAPAEKELSQ